MTQHLMNTYARLPVSFERGQGVWLWDTRGKRYLDAVSGIAVSGLGHAHPRLTQAIAAQAGRIELVELALERGLLINVTADSVVRLLPPLVMQPGEAGLLIEGLADLIRERLDVTAQAPGEPAGVAG